MRELVKLNKEPPVPAIVLVLHLSCLVSRNGRHDAECRATKEYLNIALDSMWDALLPVPKI